jgi:hypothetical protein
MTFLDTGIMVGAVLKAHPEHEICLSTGFDLAKDISRQGTGKPPMNCAFSPARVNKS